MAIPELPSAAPQELFAPQPIVEALPPAPQPAEQGFLPAPENVIPEYTVDQAVADLGYKPIEHVNPTVIREFGMVFGRNHSSSLKLQHGEYQSRHDRTRKDLPRPRISVMKDAEGNPAYEIPFGDRVTYITGTEPVTLFHATSETYDADVSMLPLKHVLYTGENGRAIDLMGLVDTYGVPALLSFDKVDAHYYQPSPDGMGNGPDKPYVVMAAPSVKENFDVTRWAPEHAAHTVMQALAKVEAENQMDGQRASYIEKDIKANTIAMDTAEAVNDASETGPVFDMEKLWDSSDVHFSYLY